MESAPLHPNEELRISDLLRLEILDSEDEQAFDEITQLASIICDTNISLISLVDEDRQWFKSRVGLGAKETHRDLAFCAHAILQDNVFEVPDTLKDKRFEDNPLVTSDPDIRFYAGTPLVTKNGMPIGTLCVIDSTPKKLTPEQTLALRTLGKQVISQMELRLHNKQLERMQQEQEQLLTMMAHDLRTPFNGILGLSRILHEKSDSVTPERVKALSSSILESSVRVYQLLDELLQWSRNRLDAVSINKETVPIETCVVETIEFMQEAFKLKSLNVIHNVPSSLSAKADISLTKTIIRNLLANAIKFSPDMGTVIIEAKKIDGKIQICVTDSGKGVSSDKINGLFENTVNSEKGTSGESGYGIGLTLCSEFVKKQGGKIWLDQDYKQGARFVFSLLSD